MLLSLGQSFTCLLSIFELLLDFTDTLLVLTQLRRGLLQSILQLTYYHMCLKHVLKLKLKEFKQRLLSVSLILAEPGGRVLECLRFVFVKCTLKSFASLLPGSLDLLDFLVVDRCLSLPQTFFFTLNLKHDLSN